MQSRPFVLVNVAMTAGVKIDTVARRGALDSGPADTSAGGDGVLRYRVGLGAAA